MAPAACNPLNRLHLTVPVAHLLVQDSQHRLVRALHLLAGTMAGQTIPNSSPECTAPQSQLWETTMLLLLGDNGSFRKGQTCPACSVTVHPGELLSTFSSHPCWSLPSLAPMVPGLHLPCQSLALVTATWQELLHGKVFHCAGAECGTCKQYRPSSETSNSDFLFPQKVFR